MQRDPIPLQGLTAQLASFVADARSLDLSPAVVRRVRIGFADTVAVMLAGRDEPVAHVVGDWMRKRMGGASGASGLKQSHVLFTKERLPSRDAALVNGAAAHALDYDDVGLQGHPSAVLACALLAEGERLGASGADVIRAYVAGFEVWAELLSRDQDVHHLKGWHPTGVFGTVGAAAAVAALRGLDAARTQHALGLAASMASGLTANFGSMAKPFHAGQAAAHGIDAVDLAEAGMTSAPDVLEHPKGFLTAFSPAGRVDHASIDVGAGRPLRIESLGLTVKKYPMCFATHRFNDGMLDLVHAHDVLPSQVKSVLVYTGPAQVAMLRNHKPTTALEAKFSLEFAIAAALVARKIGLTELQDAFVQRPDVQGLFPLVHSQVVNTVCIAEPTLAESDRVVITLQDGRTLDSGEISFARGDATAPLTDAELETKFMDCTAGIDPQLQSHLFASLQRFDQLPQVSELFTSL